MRGLIALLRFRVSFWSARASLRRFAHCGCFSRTSIAVNEMKKTRIVIAGGGFAGLYAAKYFDKSLACRADIEVTLISRENFILFTPMLHEVAAGDLYSGDIANPLRRILRHVKIVEADVQAIDLKTRRLLCAGGVDRFPLEFEFDHLLLTLGSDTNFFDMECVREWSVTMKNLNDGC